MSEICSFGIKGGKIKVNTMFHNHLRFRCVRCARFCCMLGGPPLTEGDISKLENIKSGTNQIFNSGKILKSKPNGECMFLDFDEKNARYRCDIYEFRPILCSIFPFHLQPKTGNGEYILSVLPCCGLNDSKGRRIDRNFIQNKLSPILLALLKNQISKDTGARWCE